MANTFQVTTSVPTLVTLSGSSAWFTDPACTVAATFPFEITSTKIWYTLLTGNFTANALYGGRDFGGVINVGPGAWSSINVVPQAGDSPAGVVGEGGALWSEISAGTITLPRLGQGDSGSFGSTPATGVEHFTFFRADRTFTSNTVKFMTGGTAAATSTLARVGIYSVSGATLTLMASCTNKTTFSGTFATQTCALTTGAPLVAGVVYAVAQLQVAATTGSSMGHWFQAAGMGATPLLAQTTSSNADLSASVASGFSTTTFPIYYELT